jgi:DNA-binding transcriptional MerR regulator
MSSSLIPVPPRQVTIDDAAAFVDTTPEVIREYHEIGLLPEPDLGSGDGRYGYDDMIRLLWVRKMADAGTAADDIRLALADTTAAGAGPDQDEARIRARLALLPDFVSSRLTGLPEGSLRQADLDTLLVTERAEDPLGAAVQAGRFIALAANPGLREESDRVDAAEKALDDTIDVEDPRVAQIAAERHAFDLALDAVFEESGLDQEDDALFELWDDLHPETADGAKEAGPDSGSTHKSLSTAEAVSKMPYDFSPARLRCMELALNLAYPESSAS